jgi:hypothetical protein
MDLANTKAVNDVNEKATREMRQRILDLQKAKKKAEDDFHKLD